MALKFGNFNEIKNNDENYAKRVQEFEMLTRLSEKFLSEYGWLTHPLTNDTLCHAYNDKDNYCLRSPANIYKTENYAGDPILSVKLMDNWKKYFDL